jgi:epoxyqueuosine reductase
VADRYHHRTDVPASRNRGPVGRLARYAWGDDYHKVLKQRLHQFADTLRDRWPDHVFKTCVDTAPLMEREHAARAALGWVGKHTLLIHPRLGSYLLLGAIATTLNIEKGLASEVWGIGSEGIGRASQTPAPSPQTPDPASHCGTCTRCIDACPTKCITPYQLDASRCISYLTLEHRGLIDAALEPLMGDWLGGCDVCQEVCPFNRDDRLPLDPQPHPRYVPRPPAPALPLAEVLDWTEDDRRAALRGSALKRMKLDMIRRNAVIAAGNHLAAHPDALLLHRIESIAADADEPPVVRDTARQVLARLRESPPTARRS